MKLSDPDLREQLAGRYVLGLTKGRARRRFERLLREDRPLQELVRFWESRFHPLDAYLEPRQPPRRVWRAVQRRLHDSNRPTLRTEGLLYGWRPFLTGALAAALVMALVVTLNRVPSFTPDYVGVIAEADGAPVWLVQAATTEDQLVLTPLRQPQPPPGKAYELWLLPEGDAAPVSLGLLPTQTVARRTLPQVERVVTAKGLAVSVEPAGGSPTGQPTGPVIYQAALSRSS